MTTLSIAVDENNDIYLDANGNLAIVYDLDAVRQDCDHAAKTLLGELIFDSNTGVPYLQTIFSGIVNFAQFEASLRDALLQANSAVVQVLNVSVTQTGNTVSYRAEIESTYGQTFISGSIDNAV